MVSGPIISCQIEGETMETVTGYFVELPNHCRWWVQPWNYKMLAPWKKHYDQPRQHFKKQIHYFANKGPASQRYGFSSSHVWMRVLDHKESWVLKNWCCVCVCVCVCNKVLLKYVTWVYVPWFFVLSQQRFGSMDIKALGASQLLGLDKLCYSS